MKRQKISPGAQRQKEINQRAEDSGIAAALQPKLEATARRRRDFQFEREMREINQTLAN